MQTRKLGFRGLALAFAGVLTLGLAACDDTENVPNVENITVTVSPTGTVDLEVGQSFTVVVSVQNAPAGSNTAVNFTSSNPAVASVDANGVVRALTVGATTVTAASAADANAKAAVVVRVVAAGDGGGVVGDSATVVVSSIVNAANLPVNESAVAGTFFVRLEVTPGRADSLTVMLGNTTVCRQQFNAPAASEASAEGVSAAAAAAEFVCAINTTRTNADGTPMFPNGATTLSARLYDAGAVIASASRALTLANVNALGLSVAAGDSAISPESGLSWRDGDLVVTVTPRIFTGNTTVSRVTVSLDGEDDEDGDDFDQSVTTDSATNGTFTVTFAEEDLEGLTDADLNISATSVTSAGATGPVGAELSIRYDNEAPEGGVLDSQDFIGSDVDLADLVDMDAIDDEGGVEGVTVRFFVADVGDFDDVETLDDVEAAGTEVETGADLEDMEGELDLIAVVCDALENCEVLEAFTFEVDFTPPTLELAVDDTLIYGVGDATTGDIEVEVTDDVSGFDGPGLQVSAIRTSISGTSTVTTCVIGDETNEARFEAAFTAGEDFNDFNGDGEVGGADSTCEPVTIDAAIPVPDAEGYYVFTIRAIDAAGNVSDDAETVNVLVDQETPAVDDVDFSQSLTGGDTETFTAELSDNLDLDAYSIGINYVGFGTLPLTENVRIDTSFGAPLTRTADVSASMFFVESIAQDTDGTDGVTLAGDFEADEVIVSTYDHAFNVSSSGAQTIAESFGANPGFDASVEGYNVSVDGTNDIICIEAGCDDGTSSKTLRAEVIVDVAADTDSPIDRVFFYVRAPAAAGGFTFRLIDVDETASTSVTTTERTFAYTATLTTEDLQSLDIEDSDLVTVVGIAVNEDGQGVAEFNTELTAQEA